MTGDERLKALLAAPIVSDRDAGFAARVARSGRKRSRRAVAAAILWNGVLVGCVGAAGSGAVAGLIWLARLAMDAL